MYSKILVAYDGSPGARHALRAAVDIAKVSGARLCCLSVVQHLPYFATSVDEVEEAREQVASFFRRTTEEAKTLAAMEGVEVETVVRRGHEVEAIVSFAREGGFDLLVVGFTGHSNVFGRIMGGTVQNLVRLAPCPVLVAK